jgi:Zeta toxin
MIARYKTVVPPATALPPTPAMETIRTTRSLAGMSLDGTGSFFKTRHVLVVVISGPIASGKSALSREVAAHLEEAQGLDVAVIDLDLVYEMLDPRRRPKDDLSAWTHARRIAGRVASVLLDERRCVVAEGDFATDDALREFEAELPAGTPVRLVLLDLAFEAALERAGADPTRGTSKDRAFLSAHHDAFRAEWRGREVLRLDTGQAALAETMQAVVQWLNEPC